MVIFGGINDFKRNMNDTLVYDLEKDQWITDVPIEGIEMPNLSHANGYSCFYK